MNHSKVLRGNLVQCSRVVDEGAEDPVVPEIRDRHPVSTACLSPLNHLLQPHQLILIYHFEKAQVTDSVFDFQDLKLNERAVTPDQVRVMDISLF